MVEKIDQFYDEAYEEVMGTGLIGSFWRFIHNQMNRTIDWPPTPIVLEVGAGHGQHYDQTNPDCALFIETDIREAMGYTENFVKADLLRRGRIKRKVNAEILAGVPDNSIDIVIATCILAHLTNAKSALSEWRRVTKIGGSIIIYVPCEPGLFLRFIRSLSTARKFKSKGIEQKEIHWLEHRNHYLFLDILLHKVFGSDSTKIRKFPFKHLPWDLNLYSIYTVTKL